jgi:hypothetical protein
MHARVEVLLRRTSRRGLRLLFENNFLKNAFNIFFRKPEKFHAIPAIHVMFCDLCKLCNSMYFILFIHVIHVMHVMYVSFGSTFLDYISIKLRGQSEGSPPEGKHECLHTSKASCLRLPPQSQISL